jgi:3-phenylpropionate/trans-cinnamate dioxygenase ferredoxin subunit
MSTVFHPVLDTKECPAGASKAVEVNGHDVLICNSGGDFFAVQNKCTHQDQPLEGGRIRNGMISCPSHGVIFDVRTGCGKGQSGRVPLRVYPLRVVDGQIEVSTEDNVS